jgi:dienelactone hydrolase
MPEHAATPAPRPRGCEVVLFHSVLGLRPAVRQWADQLRAAGHVVHTPDLYGGEVFDDYETGDRHVRSIGGIPALVARTEAAIERLPGELVYAGFSNGAASAEMLALTRPGARGAVLMHGALPLEALGKRAWPTGVPVQLHYAERDPMRPQAAIDSLATSVRASGSRFEGYDYPCDGHLFADPGLPDHDADSAALMLGRVLEFLDRIAGK